FLKDIHKYDEKPGEPLVQLGRGKPSTHYEEWLQTNVYKQRQAGFVVATVTLPLGDLTSDQLRSLADIAHRYCGDHVRTTVEQNIVLRWVRESDVPALYEELQAIGLGQGGAGTIVDVVACPGTDTCKLGIAS